jgi:demethylmenaquinone methyltransferase/2-methoxy-6-polyprenyl-1,4-benzoquinol methylase
VRRNGGPDSKLALARYRRLAAGYDATARREMPRRLRCIDKLALRPGDVVLDAGCGTGLSFAPLRERVGNGGRVVGVELSPEMARIARERIRKAGWNNVEVVVADLTRVPLAPPLLDCPPFNALLFHYTHDLLQSESALANVFARARPGARVAAAGLKKTHPLLFPLNWSVLWRGWRYRTTDAGLREPWRYLKRWVPDFRWERYLLDTAYIGWGTYTAAPEPAGPAVASAAHENSRIQPADARFAQNAGIPSPAGPTR